MECMSINLARQNNEIGATKRQQKGKKKDLNLIKKLRVMSNIIRPNN